MNHLKKVNNALYTVSIEIGASRLKQMAWYIINVVFFKSNLFIFSSFKVTLLRFFGARVGAGTVIKPAVNIKYPWKLEIGEHCWIGEKVWIDNLSEITIGNSVTISQGALLLTGSHDHSKETFDYISNRIVLEDGVWIGAKATVSGGVTCKSQSILGIGSVAEHNLDSYIIYKGNPAIPVITRMIY
ncbi:colanic acid biosynthesis acetyltransferase WcaF [Segetibacter sp. 3557_3]|uniref:WcaF family extracellular polysaccharide biosynthesis acetyltransferase n=1 Tax=Segetibacter sp. 3557_3 TaxID=2547429 RepID=UPI00105854F9|nr:WcaF family extracellular polysaccharide biosynthesis acetyltransferase [Segetibacter sp. 3557_3]TDH23314.1 colanic acid biosynthesis acetyltransferase WcaF [Segetibacter sp. 3557_3]